MSGSDARVGPEIDELVEDVGDVGLRLDVVELARLDQRRDAGPVFGPLVMTSEERVFAIENDRGGGGIGPCVAKRPERKRSFATNTRPRARPVTGKFH